MTQTQKLDAYHQTAVATQRPGRLIVLLYDGAIKFLNIALAELEKEDYARKGQYISKAQAIIAELNNVLDMEKGGEIAKDLRKLYLFMLRHLTRANIERDEHAIREVISQLESLNEGWRAITS